MEIDPPGTRPNVPYPDASERPNNNNNNNNNSYHHHHQQQQHQHHQQQNVAENRDYYPAHSVNFVKWF